MEPIKVESWEEYIADHPTFTGSLSNSGNNIAWYKNGKRHREDGPAIECLSGYKAWYQNGKRHREDGPAIEWANGGDKYWWLNDWQYNTEQDYKIAMRKIKLERVLKKIT